MKKHSIWDFVAKAASVHPSLYDYSKVVYLGSQTKVEILCKKHGSFWQTPGNHTNGKGCPKCAIENHPGRPTLTNPQVIKRFKAIHKGFSYEKVVYVNMQTKVEILCKKHGSFWQTPGNHLKGSACPACGRESQQLSITGRVGERSTLQTFLANAKKVHVTEAYDYSKVIYVKSNVKVEILCPKHGSFWQTPNSHLSGKRCPNCSYVTYWCDAINSYLRGFEPQAIRYIINHGLAKSNELVTKNIPAFEYRLKQRTHRYKPDFYVPRQGRIIEVKSLVTAGISPTGFKTHSATELFTKLLAKRQACIKAGFKFSLLVMDIKGNRIKLPKNWYDYSRTDLHKHLR